jgi:hypothetical protein
MPLPRRATGLIALLFLAACASTKPAATPASSAPHTTLLTSKEGGFSVQLPGPVAEGRRPQPTSLGELMLHTFIAADPSGETAYFISYTDFAEGDIMSASAREVLERASRSAVQALGGTGISQRPLTLDGFPGEEVGAVAGPRALVARFYLVGPRLYQQLLIYPQGQMPVEAETFFSSFRLDPVVAARLAAWRRR